MKEREIVESGGSDKTKPQYFVGQIQTAVNPKLLITLCVSLKTNPMSWVITFLEKGGMDSLLTVIETYFHKEDKSESTRTQNCFFPALSCDLIVSLPICLEPRLIMSSSTRLSSA